MKVMILADASSPHTTRWANALCELQIDVLLVSLTPFCRDDYHQNILLHSLSKDIRLSRNKGISEKTSYFKLLKPIKKLIKSFNPDILHAYYASSYGFIGALSRFKPFVISVWGSDVFEFPKLGFLQKRILKYNLKKANAIFATSEALAIETKLYTNTIIHKISFGIDLKKFFPIDHPNKFFTIGTIKGMRDIYGIDDLIKSFSLAQNIAPEIPWKLLLVGDGPDLDKYKNLAKSLNINNKTHFTGYIHHNDTPNYYNQMNVFVALSRSESFGVAVLEAQACGVPAIVSNVGGLPEVVDDKNTGFIVNRNNHQIVAQLFVKLATEKTTYNSLSENAINFVKLKYNWNDSVIQQYNFYKELISKYK